MHRRPRLASSLSRALHCRVYSNWRPPPRTCPLILSYRRARNTSLIISHSPHETTPDDIISAIEPVHIPPEPITSSASVPGSPSAVFLLTPSFARWLLKDELFLSGALEKAFANAIDRTTASQKRLTNGEIIRTLVAVVDRLPAPADLHCHPKPDPSNLSGINGHEGVAYALTFDDSWRSFLGDNDPGSSLGSGSGQGILEVSHRTCAISSGVGNERAREYTVQIPLTNTVFHNGLDSTMFESFWACSPPILYDTTTAETGALVSSTPETRTFHCIKKVRLQHKVLRWVSDSTPIPSIALSVPLVPLTLPRRIVNSMGNIISRVTWGGQQSVPASQELEHAVSTHFDHHGITPYAMPVWAIVTPSNEMFHQAHPSPGEAGETPSFSSAPSQQGALYQEDLTKALEYGCSIHRVLSGGGGWGKRAGLVSLDPDRGFHLPTANDTPDAIFLELDGLSAQQEILGDVARPGNYVQFLTAPPDSEQQRMRRHLTRNALSLRQQWCLEYGTVPCSIDKISDQLPAAEQASTSSKVTVHKGCFGALSEVGIGVEGSRVAGDAEEIFSRTKIDVPFSRLRVWQPAAIPHGSHPHQRPRQARFQRRSYHDVSTPASQHRSVFSGMHGAQNPVTQLEPPREHGDEHFSSPNSRDRVGSSFLPDISRIRAIQYSRPPLGIVRCIPTKTIVPDYIKSQRKMKWRRKVRHAHSMLAFLYRELADMWATYRGIETSLLSVNPPHKVGLDLDLQNPSHRTSAIDSLYKIYKDLESQLQDMRDEYRKCRKSFNLSQFRRVERHINLDADSLQQLSPETICQWADMKYRVLQRELQMISASVQSVKTRSKKRKRGSIATKPSARSSVRLVRANVSFSTTYNRLHREMEWLHHEGIKLKNEFGAIQSVMLPKRELWGLIIRKYQRRNRSRLYKAAKKPYRGIRKVPQMSSIRKIPLTSSVRTPPMRSVRKVSYFFSRYSKSWIVEPPGWKTASTMERREMMERSYKTKAIGKAALDEEAKELTSTILDMLKARW